MKTPFLRPFSLLLLLAFAGCATGPIELSIPMNRLESPEASGVQFHGQAGVGTRSTQKLTLAHDSGYDEAASNKPTVQSVGTNGANVSVGILDRLDLSVKRNADTAWITQAKYQFLGDSAHDAHLGNFSLAATAGYGSESKSGGGSGNTGTITSGGLLTFPEAKYSLKASLVDVSLIGGYRVTEKLLVYGGLSETFLNYSGSQTLFSQAASSFSENAHQDMVHFGLIHYFLGETAPELTHRNPQLFVQGEAAVARISLTKNHESSTNSNGGISFGFSW